MMIALPRQDGPRRQSFSDDPAEPDPGDSHSSREEAHITGGTTPESEPPPLVPLILARWKLPPVAVTVRPLSETDVRALEWHGGPDLRSFYVWQWEQHQAGARQVLVADYNQFPIGQLAIHWPGKPTHPHLPDIQSLRVFEAFRGMSIGSRLLQVAQAVVAERGGTHLSLSVQVENRAARRLYERLGYQTTGAPYQDDWQYVDARGSVVHVSDRVLDMVKELAR